MAEVEKNWIYDEDARFEKKGIGAEQGAEARVLVTCKGGC